MAGEDLERVAGVPVETQRRVLEAVEHKGGPWALVGLAASMHDVSGALTESIPGLRLHVFNTGENRMSALLAGPHPPWRAVPAFIIEHPSAGLIAFDLGLSQAVARDGERALPAPMRWLMESREDTDRTLDVLMQKAGLDPQRVKTVILSHLHEDHTGLASVFKGADFIAGPKTRRRMLETGHSPFPPSSNPAWREIDFDTEGHVPSPLGPAGDLLGDGSILLIGGGGHASEHVMALVHLASGPVLLTGDVVVHHDWLQSTDVERIATDPERAASLRNRILEMQATGTVLVIPGHDLRELRADRPDLIRWSPELFAPSAWPISTSRL